ncbi:hypothetical protein CBR_g75718, partial [Chara braunii]
MADKEPAVVDCDDYDDVASDDERWDDETTDVQQIWQKTMGGRSRMTKGSSSTVRRGKKGTAAGSEGEGDVEGEAMRNFWSVDHMVALIRAKRDQDAHLQGMGHTCARMKPREWKWADVEERLKKVGVERTADKGGKKWDNVMQQFKKVHLFQGSPG